MFISESVFIRRKPVGKIMMETKSGAVTFIPNESHIPRLKKLGERKWKCPVECRNEVRSFLIAKEP